MTLHAYVSGSLAPATSLAVLVRLISEAAVPVPVLVVGASTLKGYEQGQWSEALDSAGYPKERLPGQAPTRGSMEPAAPAKAAAAPEPK